MLKKIFLLSVIFFSYYVSFSQGCSDAGFCSIGTLKPLLQNDTIYRQKAKLTFSYGNGEKNTSVFQIIPEMEFSVAKKNFIQLKIPYVIANGKLGSNSGMGDFVFSISRQLLEKEHLNFSVTAGLKLPTGTTNATNKNDFVLPMPYQTGLGTTDLILGTSLHFYNWNVGAGYQKVLNHNNKNTFLYPITIAPIEDAYFESNLLRRGNDALLRAEYLFKFKKINVAPGILALYRLQKDNILNISGERMDLEGSDGLTLNITASANYSINKKIKLNLLFGAPAIVRKVRPDGLTRSMVLNFGINYNFNFKK